MGLIFHKRFFHTLGLVVALFISCDDASYELDNEFDPENLGLEPPTIFFHFPSGKVNSDGIAEIDSKVTDIDTVELYAYGIDSVAGAHLQIEFDAEVIGIETIEPGGFFKNGDNSPLIFITDEEDGYLNIYLFLSQAQQMYLLLEQVQWLLLLLLRMMKALPQFVIQNKQYLKILII